MSLSINVYNDSVPLNDIHECCICLTDINQNELIILDKIKCKEKNCNCKAYLHYKCFHQWNSIKNTCPICNSTMVLYPSFLTRVNNNKYKITFIFLFSIYFVLKFIIVKL